MSNAQDVEAGDGTTSVVVVAGALLEASEKLLQKGIHPTAISDGFQKAATKAIEIIKNMATPIQLTDRESLVKSASTALNSKVVSQQSSLLAPLAVDAVLKVVDPAKDTNVDLKVLTAIIFVNKLLLIILKFIQDIKVIMKLGGTVEDTKLVDGLVFTQKSSNVNGPRKIEKAKIGLIQFCISPPKTDVSSKIKYGIYN